MAESEKLDTQNSDKLKPLLMFGVIALCIFLIWLFIPKLLQFFMVFSGITEFNLTDKGLFGDSFGALNTLFSGLAFSAIIVTLIVQIEEFKLQRSELKKQAESLEAQVNQLEIQASEIKANRDILSLQHKEAINYRKAIESHRNFEIYFQLINQKNNYLNNLNYKDHLGVNAINFVNKVTTHKLTQHLKHNPNVKIDFLTALVFIVKEVIQANLNYFSQYNSALFSVLSFIDQCNSDDSEKIIMINLLKNNLSIQETQYILFLVISEINVKLNQYLKETKLLNSLDFELLKRDIMPDFMQVIKSLIKDYVD
jgi:hypothetical protein